MSAPPSPVAPPAPDPSAPRTAAAQRSRGARAGRRRVLLGGGLGLLGLLVLGAGPWWAAPSAPGPGPAGAGFAPGPRAVWRALAEAVLDGLLPPPGPDREAALDGTLLRLAATVQALPPPERSDVQRLIDLLRLAPLRRLWLGLRTPWAEARPAQVQAALQTWRRSANATTLQAYRALRDLINAAHLADPAAWAAIGYPGPSDV